MSLASIIFRICLCFFLFVVTFCEALTLYKQKTGDFCLFDEIKVGAIIYWERCITSQNCPVDTPGNVSELFMGNVVIDGITYKYYVANYMVPITCTCDGHGKYTVCGRSWLCTTVPCNNTIPKCGNKTKANYRWVFSNTNNMNTEVRQYQDGYAVLPHVKVKYIAECIQQTNNSGSLIPCGQKGCN
ncbi:MAG: hypothetical protein LBE18_09745 [Planctomycetaceae bacterium]|jgi:hypothetical protein|nr:hypothetical protein [Planctomycetaceae bacterium]